MAECRNYLLPVQAESQTGDRRLSTQQSTETFQERRSRLMFSLWILRSELILHWSSCAAVGCMWWRRPHPSSLYSTVAHQGVGIPCRVIQLGESEMPFVPLATLLVHDKALLGVLPERDTEFTQIRGITNVASSHRNVSHPMSPLSSHSSVCIGSTSAIHLQIQKKQSHACRCEHKRDEPLLEKTVHRNSQDHSAGRASHMRGCV